MIRIDETTTIEAPIQRCFDLSRSVEVHLLRNIHSGEQALAIDGHTSGLQGLADPFPFHPTGAGSLRTAAAVARLIVPDADGN